jgi:hypothetical protein
MLEKATSARKDPKPDAVNFTKWGFTKMLMGNVKERASEMAIRDQLSKQDIRQMANDLSAIIGSAKEAVNMLTDLALFGNDE